jgi:hypothetical protein
VKHLQDVQGLLVPKKVKRRCTGVTAAGVGVTKATVLLEESD